MTIPLKPVVLLFEELMYADPRHRPDLTVIALTRRIDLPLLWSAQEQAGVLTPHVAQKLSPYP